MGAEPCFQQSEKFVYDVVAGNQLILVLLVPTPRCVVPEVGGNEQRRPSTGVNEYHPLDTP